MKMNKNDWDAEYYKKHSEPQQEGAEYVLEQIQFHGDEVVLDIGCGDGKITKDIAQKVPTGKVIGIDPSENMIEECKKSFSDIKNLSFERTGAEDFYFDFPFDLIVSFFAMHYVKDHLKALKNIFRTLRPGGKFIAFMAGGNQPDIEQILKKESWLSLLSEQEIRWHAKTEDEYKPLLKEAGFDKIDVRTEWHSRFFDTQEDLLNWTLGWIPYVTGFDKEKALELAKEIVKTISKGKEENIEMISPLLYVKAQRPRT